MARADCRQEPEVGTLLDRFADAAVLVVDDNEANVALVHAVLSRAGLSRIKTVTDSTQAMAGFEELRPDIVLLDLHMPGIDGYTLLDELRQRAGGSYLPVLVLTADTTREATHRALGLGARDFLTKPIDTMELILRVRNLLETRELHDRLRHHNLALQGELAGYQWTERAELQAREHRLAQVRHILADDLMSLVYQPIVDLSSGDAVGFEALARFPVEPNRGPDRWFADAMDVGLGPELELMAVKHALAVQDELPGSAFVAVNLSPATILAAELPVLLGKADGPRLVIELTEHVPVEDFEAIGKALAMLRSEGVRLAVDDTGAGYAGFRHLLGLNPDIIKLDISLTRGIDADPARRALAAALVKFSDDTGAELIAEGVETASELSTLVELGIDWAQGYFLARPAPLDTHLTGGVGHVARTTSAARQPSIQPSIQRSVVSH
jgi:EAL domain-containing protein (putative c-di-GMP-specific phosphodiesterase class I)/DNA-binding response OmpR family regulator